MDMKEMKKIFLLTAGVIGIFQAGMNSAVAGGPAWQPPSAAQCIYQSNISRLTFQLTTNTAWDKCKEAFRRYQGIDVKITGSVRQNSTGRIFSINHQDVLKPGKYVYPSVNTGSGMQMLYRLNPKEYTVLGAISFSESWRK
ncbi:hypothetical protein BHZ80_28005 [Salmonella enterica]|nr:hypothetical protein [Salmonella enterica]EAA9599021.1 hypothetical protein [Salmonella enterica]EAO9641711.1 hypothetical protein [Salmonella enterica]EKI3327345.1 hypothetical protein [Salmonella enterica]